MCPPGPLDPYSGKDGPVPSPVGPRTPSTHPKHPAGGKKHGKHRGSGKFVAHDDGMGKVPPAAYFSTKGWTFRREQFFAAYAKEKMPAIKKGHKDDLGNLLGYIEKDTEVTDLRHIAYMLATVCLECAMTWLPIEEYGKGRGRKGTAKKPDYGDAVTVKDAAGKSYSHVYYGRGFVQLTWEKNYASCGKELHRLGLVDSDDELVIKPERALEPALAYPIMSFGMRKGIFTGISLNKYIHGAACDYFNSRRIINKVDAAATIEGYAVKLEHALYAAVAPVEDALSPELESWLKSLSSWFTQFSR